MKRLYAVLGLSASLLISAGASAQSCNRDCLNGDSDTYLGAAARRYRDPVQSQAGYFGTVQMGQEEAVVALRLKVQWNQVTEAEWFISRKSDPGVTGEPGKTPFSIETLKATLPAQRVVPKAERMQREALQAVVNSYFDGITNHNGFIVKGHP